jgi:hypothetical protein
MLLWGFKNTVQAQISLYLEQKNYYSKIQDQLIFRIFSMLWSGNSLTLYIHCPALGTFSFRTTQNQKAVTRPAVFRYNYYQRTLFNLNGDQTNYTEKFRGIFSVGFSPWENTEIPWDVSVLFFGAPQYFSQYLSKICWMLKKIAKFKITEIENYGN